MWPVTIKKPVYRADTRQAAVHYQFRKLTKTKGAFSNENSLLKLLYIGIQQASEKMDNVGLAEQCSSWGQTITQLSIYFEGR